jgi:hypothetical protein
MKRTIPTEEGHVFGTTDNIGIIMPIAGHCGWQEPAS